MVKNLKKLIIFFIFILTLTSCSIKTNNELSKREISFDITENFKDYKFVGVSNDESELFVSKLDKGNLFYEKIDKNGNIKKLFELQNVFSIVHEGVYEDLLYFVIAENIEDKLSVNFVSIDKNGKVRKFWGDENQPVGTSMEFLKLPYVQNNAGKLFITNEYNTVDKKIGTRLLVLDLVTFNLDVLDEQYYSKDDSGKINGSYIMFTGSMGEYVYYQVLECNNVASLEEAKSVIYRKNLNDLEENNTFDIKQITSKEIENVNSRKLLFLSGDEKVLITSDYILDENFYDSGYFNIIDGKVFKSYKIDGVTAGNDIINSFKIGENYIVETNDKFFVYDQKGNKKEEMNLKESQSLLKKKANGFYFAEMLDNKLKVSIFEYK